MKPDPENRSSSPLPVHDLLKLLLDVTGIAFAAAEVCQFPEQPVGEFRNSRHLHIIRTAASPPGWFGPPSQPASLLLIEQ